MEIEKLLRDSWEIFQKNPVPLVAGTFILLLIALVQIIPIIGWFAIILIPPLIYGLTSMAVKGTKGENIEFNDLFAGLKSNEFIQSLIVCSLLIIATVLGIFSFILSLMGAVFDSKVLFTLVIILGIIRLILLIIQAILLIYAMPLLVMRGYKGIDAIKEAIELIKANPTDSIILLIVLSILNLIGFLALIVGLLVTIPINIIGWARTTQTLIKN